MTADGFGRASTAATRLGPVTGRHDEGPSGGACSTRHSCSDPSRRGRSPASKSGTRSVAVIAIGLIGWVMAKPAVAAYLLIFLTPLVVGINAGVVVPGVAAERRRSWPVRRGHRPAMAGWSAHAARSGGRGWTASMLSLIALGRHEFCAAAR